MKDDPMKAYNQSLARQTMRIVAARQAKTLDLKRPGVLFCALPGSTVRFRQRACTSRRHAVNPQREPASRHDDRAFVGCGKWANGFGKAHLIVYSIHAKPSTHPSAPFTADSSGKWYNQYYFSWFLMQ